MAKKKTDLTPEARIALIKDVKDLINQAVIKMKDVGDIEYNDDYDGEGNLFAMEEAPIDPATGEPDEDFYGEAKDQELESLKDVLKTLVKGNAQYVAEKYMQKKISEMTVKELTDQKTAYALTLQSIETQLKVLQDQESFRKRAETVLLTTVKEELNKILVSMSSVKDTTYIWSATELEAIKGLLKIIVEDNHATTAFADYYNSSKDC